MLVVLLMLASYPEFAFARSSLSSQMRLRSEFQVIHQIHLLIR